ncbi:hypothetical protein ELI07_32875 (plasmid) [Rhizobium leguminosarum]|uniref:hypothetical protein n=1 Tax=Rhizobium leguminosarum TaxID=384 RepID=UPI0010304312|nr:hypothetical protein [Rhizobium leguminosarum]TAX01980.1 hypothetical protein ELI07_32875 [Rhizobium leguminosarum]TAZ03248.1 hypothetical protein ELH81_31030 [Rhizobium leguminosarum]
MPRDSSVLKGHAEEEAAKILILMDIMRCPKKVIASRIATLMGWHGFFMLKPANGGRLTSRSCARSSIAGA